MTTNNTFNNQNREENNTFSKTNSQDLTEQWKKGELKEGHYYLKDNEYIFIDHFNGVSFEETCDFEIKEILAPVPSYEEWMLTNYSLDDYKRLCDMRGKIINKMEESNADAEKHLRQENQKLKELLQDCKQMFVIEKSFLVKCSRLEDIENIITKIDEVLK